MLDNTHSSSADQTGENAVFAGSNVIAFPGHCRGSLAERARARRDWLMARWAADQIGFDPADARCYALRLAADTSAQDSLVHRIHADFHTVGLPVATEALLRKLDDFHIQAVVWARCNGARA